MASFTPEEMDFLKSHGNELNRKVYLGLYDSRQWPEPDSRDEQRVRDYMVQKYENRRWYVAATDAMREEARRTNEAALTTGKQQSKTPLRWQLGEHATAKPTIAPPASSGVTVPLPGAVKTPFAAASAGGIPQLASAAGKLAHPPVQPAAASTTTSSSSSGFDLLGDLGGDPFASTGSGNVANHTGDAGGFADFSSFNSISSATPAASAVPAPPAAAVPPQKTPQAFPPLSSTPLQPLGIGQAPAQPPASSAQNATSNGGDRYAALADLDSAFSAPATTATSINWGGMPDATASSGGGLNWGGSTSSSGGVVAWNGTSSAPSGVASGQINWNSQPGLGTVPASSTFATPAPGKPGNPFLSSMPAANPFSASAGLPGGMTPFSSAAPASSVNPFGVPNSMAAGHFSQAGGQGMMPAASIAGAGQFPTQFGGQPSSVGAGFAQFPPIQNGTGGGAFGMPGVSAFGSPAGFPAQQQQQQFMMAPQQHGGWGQMGAQPMANPFMNAAATMQNQVPPPSGSSNPFL